MDIAAWLRSLGLERYEPAFRDNDIDAEVLPRLTAEDLVGLGVTSIGHRRKLLEAIAALRAQRLPAPLPAATAGPASAAERRLLTLMFCDLVGSTPLSRRLDPEDLREVIGAYHRSVAETITRFGGFVAKYMGDGVLAYFGYPQAHEDDAERAVRAAIALVGEIGRLETDERLKLRVGIATGLVVVGDLLGSGAAQEYGVVGETPNLAARLQAAAPENGVLIGEATRRLLGDLFEYRDLGAVEIKGFGEPLPIFEVLRPSAVESRFEALRAAALTPLIGREEEIELLLRRWRRAAEGGGQLVLICGEPGIGKSRLAAALRERLEGEDLARLRYFASPHHQESALYPFIAQLEHAALLEREDPVDKKLDKLEALLALASPPAEDVGLVAELLSLPPRYPLPPSTPQRKKEKTFAALLRQLEALARQKPVLMVFEDLHWIDPSSRELIDRVIKRIASLPALLVATFRPEFAPPWSGLPHVTALTLSRLDRRAGAAMVEGIAGSSAISREVAAEIIERTDGIPLFVEELTKAVLEAGGGSEGIERTLAGALAPSAAVPAALHSSLMARLDRLGQAAKEVAQIAAAIGREFSWELLAPVAERRAEELLDGLGRLAAAGLIFRRGAPPHATYLFKHALVRDAAYESLLRRRRTELHARIAKVLEAGFPDRIAAEPELLARHLTEAGSLEKAVRCWQHAGERATERWANIEAIAHLKRGLGILERLADSRERDEQELLLQFALMAPSTASEGYASAALKQAASRAIELGGRIGTDSPVQHQAVWARGWLASVHMNRGELRTGLAIAEENLGVAERLGDSHTLTAGHYWMGLADIYSGNLAAARRHLEEGLALYDPERDRAKAARLGFDIRMVCHAMLGLVLLDQGYPDEALRHAEEAIAAARAAAHPLSEALSLTFAAMLHEWRGEVAPCLERAEAALALATEQVLPVFAAHAVTFCDWAVVKKGQAEEAFIRLRAGIDAQRAIGTRVWRLRFLALLAEACLETGRIEEGLSTVREVIAEAEEAAIPYHQAELNRLEGELLLASKEPDDGLAEASLRKALAIARGQAAKSFELKAATSLARLFARQGKREEAHALLAPIYGWFTEGFDTADLIAAKALLAQLAP
jgi:class 3 adenylate cyclase/predicted ATPase